MQRKIKIKRISINYPQNVDGSDMNPQELTTILELAKGFKEDRVLGEQSRLVDAAAMRMAVSVMNRFDVYPKAKPFWEIPMESELVVEEKGDIDSHANLNIIRNPERKI